LSHWLCIAQEGRIEEEMFLTTFLFEEAKHVDFFNLFLEEVVGDVGDISHYHAPGYSEIFYQILPEVMQALDIDPSPAAQVRASITYNMAVEGVMAEVGYFHWFEMLRGKNIMPGMQKGLEYIKMDESRHIAYGVFLLTRLIAADDGLWPVVEETFAMLKPYVVGDDPPEEVDDPGHEMSKSLFEKRINRLRRARTESVEEIYKVATLVAEREQAIIA
ncbi:MAG: ribonucleotide-diphosphate reductase, partial [Chloroflexota bacterium]